MVIMSKIIWSLLIVLLISVSGVGYFFWFQVSDELQENAVNFIKYESQASCEQATSRSCVTVVCDFVPGDEMYESVCGTGASSWWQSQSVEATWESYIDYTRGISFKYPQSLGTKYISVVDWPPGVEIFDEDYACLEAGTTTALAGRTAEKKVLDTFYCVTEVVEGAAGSIYTQYAYAFSPDAIILPQAAGKTVVLIFTTRAVQCLNYDEPLRRECEEERREFDVDAVVHRIAQTLKTL